MRKRSNRKICAIILTAVMAISSITAEFRPAFAAEEQTTADNLQRESSIYAKWTAPTEALPDGTTRYASVSGATDAYVTIIDTETQQEASPVFGATLNVGSAGMGSSEKLNQKYLFALNPNGQFKDFELSFTTSGSNTGAKNWTAAYSINGTDYTDIKAFEIESSSARLDCAITIPTEANGTDKLYISLAPSGTTSINGKEIGTGGTNYLTRNGSEITITANAIGDTTPEEPKPEEPKPEEPKPEEPKPEEPGEEGVSTIADVKKAASGEFTVQGTVIFVDGRNIYIEDATGGICLRLDAALDTITVGKKVKAKGTYSVYNGSIQLENVVSADCTVEEGTLPEAKIKTIAEINANGVDTLQSTRVKIQGAKIGAINTSGNTVLSQGTDMVNIYKCPALEGIKEGDTVDVIATVGVFNSVQLRVASAADVTKASSTPDDDSNKDEVKVDETITVDYAQWITGEDLGEKTDLISKAGADATAALTVINKAENKPISPIVTTTGGTGTNYNIGSKGMGSSTLDGQYLFTLNPKGKFGNYKLSLSMRGSNTVAKNWAVAYSTDGKNYTNATIFTIETGGVYADYSATIPASANGSDKLYISISPVAGTTAINGNAVGTGGAHYLSGIMLTANPVLADDICQAVKFLPESGAIAVGQTITCSSGTENATIKYTINNEEEKVYEKPFTLTEEQLKDGAKISAHAEKEGCADSAPTAANYTWVQVGAVKAAPNGGAVNIGKEVSVTCETEGVIIQYSEDQQNWKVCEGNKLIITELPKTYYVRAIKEGYKPSGALELKYTERANEKYNIYFGQVHSHTSYSDGAGTCEEAYQYASKVEGLDFLAVTDHSNSFDNANSASILDGTVSEEWVEGHKLAEQYTTEEFVPLFGYEMTWSNGLGHMNTFNTNGFQSRTQADYSVYGTALQNYYAALKTDPNSISQFNHPGTTFGDFSDFAHYDEELDNLITIIEVGNGEGAIGSSGYFPSYEYYQRALDKGWHVAPTNNQDNHKGRWGDANTGKTVVLADTLTRDNIYDAIRNYRVYATEDADLNIYYTLDGNEMGTILSKGQTGDTVKIKAELKDESGDSLGKVEVITQGGQIVAEKSLTTSEEIVEFDVDNNYPFYYLKVTESDGDIAVTAPVWVDEVIAAGVSGISTDEVLPVKGQELTVNLGLYNNESEPMIIDSLQFSIGGEVIHTADLSNIKSIEPFGTAEYSFGYTCNKTGKIQIDAIINGSINGVPIISNASLNLTYVLEEMITKVLIDGTHYNDYVTGYYGGRVGNFTKIAGDKSVRVEVVKDKITKEMLEDCNLLIISAPAKRSGEDNAGSYQVSHFEDEFIDMVKAYTDAGGTLITCGLADYQDRTTGQTTTEMNKLLNAIGATTELYSDEAYDEENNGGQPYRLYLKNFNADSKYLKNAVADEKDADGNIISEGQTYSAYSGCTVKLNEEAVAAGKAEALIKGYDTTYSINTKDDNGNNADNAVVVEKGNVVMLAHEQLASGANVFVGGTVFMSDFEVKAELDNIWDLPYLNRTIVENILDEVAVKLKPTSIAEVRKNGEMGDIYAIEGYVTAGTSKEGNIFFDAIYVQDDTAGITVFPYSVSGLEVGTKIYIIGYVDAYQGDKEIQILQSEVLPEEEKKVYEPEKLSAKIAMDYDLSGGKLVQVEGKVVDALYDTAGTGVSQFWLDDGSGENANIFIDGYILSGTTQKNELASIVKVGQWVSAVGIVYAHPEGESDIPITCLRVRDCDEIKAIAAPEEPKPEDPKPGDSNNGGNNNNNGSSNGSNSGSTNGGNTNNNKPDDTNTQPPEGTDDTTNTTIEEKPDGTKIETTIEKKEDGSIKKTVIETRPNGYVKETVTETKPDGSSVETKKVTVADNSATLQATTKVDTAGNASTNAVISTGVSKAGNIAISKELLEDIANSKNVDSFAVEISGQTIISTTPSKVNTVVTVSIPEVEGTNVDKIVLTKDGIAAAKATQKGLKVTVENGSKNHTVTIPAKQLAKVSSSVEELNISVKVDNAGTIATEKKDLVNALTASKGKQDKACVVSIAKNEEAAKMGLKVTIPVTDKAGVAGNATVYIYKYNAKTGKLEEVANSKQKVSANGTVLIEAVSGADYVVSAKKLSGNKIKTIVDNIKISIAKNTVKNGKSVKVKVSLPDTASTGSKFAAEKAKITYKSSNKRIASVSASGVVKAKKKGTVTITTTVKLESGQKVTKKKKITVK